MAIRKKDTLLFAHPPVIAAWAAVGGRQEAKGPLAPGFDELVEDASFAAEGCRSWEANCIFWAGNLPPAAPPPL